MQCQHTAHLLQNVVEVLHVRQNTFLQKQELLMDQQMQTSFSAETEKSGHAHLHSTTTGNEIVAQTLSNSGRANSQWTLVGEKGGLEFTSH